MQIKCKVNRIMGEKEGVRDGKRERERGTRVLEKDGKIKCLIFLSIQNLMFRLVSIVLFHSCQ